MAESTAHESWQVLERILDSGDADRLQAFVDACPSGELARAISLLDDDKRGRVLMLLPPESGAEVLDELSHAQAAEIIDDLPVDQAAAIINEMPSDEQADLLVQLDEDDADAILEKMDPAEAADARTLASYPSDTAGSIMVTEYLAYPQDMTADDVVADLRANAERYADYDVQFIYVLSRSDGVLLGGCRFRDLVLSLGQTRLEAVVNPDLPSVPALATLDELEEFFDGWDVPAAPVVDERRRLVGLVRRSHVEEALGDRSDQALLRVGGIVSEELRTMPMLPRAMRRLTFLLPNIVLSGLSVTIIALFEPIIARITVLAAFLPLVANLSGAAGNQAVAVSIRELSLGLVQPRDWWRVCGREAGVGLVNGLIIGAVLIAVAGAMVQHDLLLLAVLVGVSYSLNSVMAVMLGGSIPLLLRGWGVDPAIAASPLLTTFTDACSFFVTLLLSAGAIRFLGLA